METNFELEEELSLSRDVGRQDELLRERFHSSQRDVIQVSEHARLTHDAQRRSPVVKLQHGRILQRNETLQHTQSKH